MYTPFLSRLSYFVCPLINLMWKTKMSIRNGRKNASCHLSFHTNYVESCCCLSFINIYKFIQLHSFFLNTDIFFYTSHRNNLLIVSYSNIILREFLENYIYFLINQYVIPLLYELIVIQYLWKHSFIFSISTREKQV